MKRVSLTLGAAAVLTLLLSACYGSGSSGVYVGVAVPAPWYGPYPGRYYPPAYIGPPYYRYPEEDSDTDEGELKGSAAPDTQADSSHAG